MDMHALILATDKYLDNKILGTNLHKLFGSTLYLFVSHLILLVLPVVFTNWYQEIVLRSINLK